LLSKKEKRGKQMDWREKFENLRKKHAQVVKQRPLPAPTPVTTINQANLRMKNFKEMQGRLARNKSIVPNLAVQSKIFVPTRKGRRKFFREWTNVEIIGNNNIKIITRGDQLNQLDLTGWLVLTKFLNKKDFICTFTRYEFLKAMRKSDSSRDYQWLRSFLDRIGFTQFIISVVNENGEELRYRGSLAPQDFENKTKKHHVVQLSKVLYAFFGLENWSLINLDQRFALGQNQWAQAFHAYLSTHKSPFWSTKENLWKVWGSEYKNVNMFLKDFRRRVLKPLYDIRFIKKIDEKKTALGVFY